MTGSERPDLRYIKGVYQEQNYYIDTTIFLIIQRKYFHE
jgi:hypothetical protein